MDSQIKKHYQSLYAKHKDSPLAVQYANISSQFRRFEILTQIAPTIESIMDVGCGLGHLFKFLTENGYKGKYLGVDFVPEFIEAARDKFIDSPNAQFKLIDVIKEDLPSCCDYVVLSGVFNNKCTSNKSFIFNTIDKLFKAARKGVAFNAMSTYVDYMDDHLYYSNPLEVFDFCKKNLTRKVVLRHDYLVKEDSIPFEYTIYLYQ